MVPTGTVTFVFTDVVDSSRLWDRFPIEMRSALERHDEVLRAAIESAGGHVFTTAGDSFAAAFSTADAAAGAVLAIQHAIGAEEWPENVPVRVRIGIHTGEAHERDGDYFGPAVNRAARIESAGHGGQVLVSSTTARVLAGSTAHRWHLTGLGEHRLKGLAEPEVIHQLDSTAAPADFGPLATVAVATTNLTGHAPELVGRDADLTEVETQLADHRLVTVTGVGGVGKTSLAAAVAHSWLGRVDEVWLVELAPVSDPSVVASRLSKTVSIAGSPAELDEIASVLARRGPVLVVLDNCEHVIDAAAGLAEALAELDNVSVLATSRLALETSAEQIIHLGPLGVADPAVELFTREARRRTPGWEPRDSAVIVEICEAVDGIPLAIELAAAKTRSMGATEILERLDHVLATAPRRGRGERRHATMTAAIDWSIDLLDDATRELLGVLTVFAGTFDLTAIEAVTARLDLDLDPGPEVDELVAHSLVETVRTDIGVRYRLLEPVRQRAETLVGDLTSVREAHRDHYLSALEAAYGALGSTSSDAIIAILHDDLDNLRALHEWALERNDIEHALRIFRPLAIAAYHEIFEVGDWALDILRRNPPDDTPRLCDAHLAVGMTASFRHGDGRDFSESWGAIMRLPEGRVDRPLVALATGMSHIGKGDIQRAVDVFEACRDGDTTIRFTYWFMARLYRSIASPVPRPSELFEDGISWARTIGARNIEAGLLEVAALSELGAGNPDRAESLATEAEALSETTQMWHVRGRAVEHRTKAALLMGTATPAQLAPQLARLMRSAVSSGAELRAGLAFATAALLFDQAGNVEFAGRVLAAAPDMAKGQAFGVSDAVWGSLEDHPAFDETMVLAMAEIVAEELDDLSTTL